MARPTRNAKKRCRVPAPQIKDKNREVLVLDFRSSRFQPINSKYLRQSALQERRLCEMEVYDGIECDLEDDQISRAASPGLQAEVRALLLGFAVQRTS